MGSILRRVVALVALAIGIGVAAGTAPAAAATTHSVNASSITTAQTAGPRLQSLQATDWWF